MSVVSQDAINNRLLRRLAAEDFEAVRPCLETVDLPMKVAVTETGCRIEHLHFLDSGLASVVVSSVEDDERIEVGHVGWEGVTGTAACLGVSTAGTRTFMQIAGAAWRLAVADYGRIAAERPAVGALMLRYVHTHQMQVAYSALANARYSLRECLARWLLMTHDRADSDDLPMTHEFLSLMIGVRRAGVTGELTVLEGMGMVRATRGSIRILDRPRLLSIAGGCYGQPEALYEALIGSGSPDR